MTTTLINDKLKKCAEAANLADQSARKMFGQGLNFCRSAGNAILEAKEHLPHGGLTEWIKANCTFSLASAQVYQRIAKEWPAIEARRATEPDLSLRGALSMLTDQRNEARQKNSSAVDLIEKPLGIQQKTGNGPESWSNETISQTMDRVDYESLVKHVRLPPVGMLIVGEHADGWVVVESIGTDARWVRCAATKSFEGEHYIDFTCRGFVRAFTGLWLENASVDTATLNWCDPVPATAANNPFADVLPEWSYPAAVSEDGGEA